MPKKSRRTKRSKAGFLVVALICFGAVAALAAYVRNGHEHVPPSEQRTNITESPTIVAPVTRRDDSESAPAPSGKRAFIYSPVWKNTADLEFTKTAEAVPAGVDPRVFAVNQYLANTKIAEGAQLDSVAVRDGTASLNFNSAMNHTYGTDDESMLLNGILTTMGQFPGIEKVEFLADGKKIDTFGNVDLSAPVAVIRQGKSPVP